MSQTLDGVRVLELARFQAGPRGGMILSDLGAEVIKIEPPGGEETRRHQPVVRGQSVYFTVYNRGKKSVCLDLRSAQGKRSSPPSCGSPTSCSRTSGPASCAPWASTTNGCAR
jgi:CoA:oxalate CoA-transferase